MRLRTRPTIRSATGKRVSGKDMGVGGQKQKNKKTGGGGPGGGTMGGVVVCFQGLGRWGGWLFADKKLIA